MLHTTNTTTHTNKAIGHKHKELSFADHYSTSTLSTDTTARTTALKPTAADLELPLVLVGTGAPFPVEAGMTIMVADDDEAGLVTTGGVLEALDMPITGAVGVAELDEAACTTGVAEEDEAMVTGVITDEEDCTGFTTVALLDEPPPMGGVITLPLLDEVVGVTTEALDELPATTAALLEEPMGVTTAALEED